MSIEAAGYFVVQDDLQYPSIVKMKVELSPEKPTEEIPTADPYTTAEAEFMRRVEVLQEAGQMRRAAQIETEEQLDEHFDALSRLYRQVCGEMGLPWPPPPLDALDSQDERKLGEDGEQDTS